jgi:hypothetical protein
MATKSETRSPEDRREYAYYVPGPWVTYVTTTVALGITRALAVAITVGVAILVLVGGLWLAYTYLPMNVFYIILAVLVADIVFGMVLRVVLSRR